MKTLSTLLLVLTMSFTFGLAEAMAQPANDLIVNAIDLGFGPIPYTESNVDFPNATLAGDGTTGSGCTIVFPGVWYKFTATKVGTVVGGILDPNGATIIFFEGPATGVTNGTQLTHVNQGNNPCAQGPLANIQTSIGTTYYIYMRNTVVSDVVINTSTTFQVPENDLIENAIDLNGLEDYFDEDIHFLMSTNTNGGGAVGCNINEAGIWYKFTAGTNGQVVAGISSAPNNGGIIFYSADDENATSGSELTWVNSPNNPCSAGNLRSIDAIAGTTYYVFTGMLDPYGDFSINLSQILNNSEHTIVDFEYYPNPVVNELKIKAKTTINEIKIYYLTGQLVLHQKINSTDGNISLTHLTNGMYLAEITAEGKSSTFKIVKK